MYVILTSKPDLYRTEANADIRLIEAWDYVLEGRVRARFQLGELLRETRVNVIETGDTPTINSVPSKFLERFDTLEEGRGEIRQLCSFGKLDARLVAVPLGEVADTA
ncbi:MULTISPECIES: ferredoxin [unclassified Achromobacter]|uniref:ferredoxin n=1 Tax=unclassified Achromobacter TaxID=2626865 RepID=UPI000B516F87|nr:MULTISPECIES: ferredoxin [unclassified Achromobacter]OWT80372.1 ferredoxin [Achromobacter sp. HZ34]OWT82255.1 ferredoxin [Achromobacter sp. HZ28]